MDYWLISDTHFNHTRLERWGGRSGDWQQQLWRGLERIPADDVLVHLGDVCMGNDEAVNLRVTSIAARSKVLVLGNHDTKSTGWYHEHGWDFVCDSFALPYMGHSLWLSHRPEPEMGRFTENIHGHTHGNRHRAEEYAAFYRPSYHKDISPELVGFQPIRLDTLVQDMKPGKG